MKIKSVFFLVFAWTIINASSALAAIPSIKLIFTDPQNLCKTSSGETQFAFNYKYVANGTFEYFSGPVNINQSFAFILVPPPLKNGLPYYYSDFEITDQGDCGDLALNYNQLGNCFATNLIPSSDQQKPYSYQIKLTPQMAGSDPFGKPMYNLKCHIEEE